MNGKREDMVIMSSSISLSDYPRLLKGEKIKCPECNKGYFVRTHPNAEIDHEFRCNNCGAILRFEPNVEVK